MSIAILFGEGVKPVGSPFDRPEIYYGTAGLVVALLIGAAVIFFVDRWRKQDNLKAQGKDIDELTSFRALFERGEITEREYNRLRDKVASRAKLVHKSMTPSDGKKPETNDESATKSPQGPSMSGPLPSDYFDEPKLSDKPSPPQWPPKPDDRLEEKPPPV